MPVDRLHRCQGYSPCLPPGPDVDCAGGSGDGPRYVNGPVHVNGSDRMALIAMATAWPATPSRCDDAQLRPVLLRLQDRRLPLPMHEALLQAAGFEDLPSGT